ncbi:hypothetical protein ACP4OV_015088 [Aristida adscensionis]
MELLVLQKRLQLTYTHRDDRLHTDEVLKQFKLPAVKIRLYMLISEMICS